MALPAPRGTRIALLVARVFALLAAAIGAFVLVGWQFDLSAVTGHLPISDCHEAKCCGRRDRCGDWALLPDLSGPPAPRAGCSASSSPCSGVATLSQDLFGIDLGIDQIAVAQRSSCRRRVTADVRPHGAGHCGIADPVRPRAALRQAGQGGLSLQPAPGHHHAGQVLIVLTGYAYGVATVDYPFPFTSMSVYGTASSLLLAVGLLAASPEFGIAAAIVESLAGRRDAAASAARHHRAAARHRLVRPSGRACDLLRQRRDARHLRRGQHRRAGAVRLDHDRRRPPRRSRPQRGAH